MPLKPSRGGDGTLRKEELVPPGPSSFPHPNIPDATGQREFSQVF